MRLLCFFFFNDTATTEIYTLSLHDALPISELAGIYGVIFTAQSRNVTVFADGEVDRSPCGSGTSARLALLDQRGELSRGATLRSEEHTSELQSQSNLVCRLLLDKKKNPYAAIMFFFF